MREAMGGALLIKLVMFFIVIYVCFLGIAINYSITFRVKNQIINLIEEYEGYELAKPHIEEYVANVGYYRASNSGLNISNDGSNGYCWEHHGYLICEETNESIAGEKTKKYYKVTAYVSFDFPIIGEILNFPVSGETKVIYKG